jgi:hypothetical protein
VALVSVSILYEHVVDRRSFRFVRSPRPCHRTKEKIAHWLGILYLPLAWMGEDTWLSLKRPGFALAVRPRFSFPMTSLASTSHPPDPHAVSDHLPSHSSTTLLASTWQILDQVFYSPPSLPLISLLTPSPPATAPHPSRNSWGLPLAR